MGFAHEVVYVCDYGVGDFAGVGAFGCYVKGRDGVEGVWGRWL